MVSHVNLNKIRRILDFISVVWGGIAAEMKNLTKDLASWGLDLISLLVACHFCIFTYYNWVNITFNIYPVVLLQRIIKGIYFTVLSYQTLWKWRQYYWWYNDEGQGKGSPWAGLNLSLVTEVPNFVSVSRHTFCRWVFHL